MWRSVASNGITLLIVAMVVLGIAIGNGVRQYESEGPLAEAICLKVAPGSTMARVSENLAEQEAVSDARLFRIGAKYTERDDQLKAGSFLIPEEASMAEILDIVTASGQSTCGTDVVFRIGVAGFDMQVREIDPATNRSVVREEFVPGQDEPPALYTQVRDAGDTRFRVTLAEGVTSWQAIEALGMAEFLSGEVDEVPDEGRLAPDSYEVTDGASRGDLMQRMVDRQSERLATIWQTRDAGLPYDTPEEALIMASIVEKETGIAEERGQVASVFVNRLREGMRLQTDPTVIYGVTEGRGVLGRGLRRSELDRETPYNTYLIDGLPPTPIANPGLDALEAAVSPDSTDYLYFVADGTGGHAFAETLAEHNDNVARWRAIEAERANN